MLSDEKLTGILSAVKTIAVLGASDKPGRPVDMVAGYLISAGFEVIPVRPARETIWGLKAYPRLADVPVNIDLVDVFRAPEHCPGHAGECLALKSIPGTFWMQSGIYSLEAEMLLTGKMNVVSDRCLMVEHRRLFGMQEFSL